MTALCGLVLAGCDSSQVGEAAAKPHPGGPPQPALARKKEPAPAPLPALPQKKEPPLESPQTPPLTGKYYVMNGEKYYLLASAEGFVEEGMASWYGRRFQGRKTSSGERYDMHELTAAHPTLPFDCLVRVVNLENSREVTVRINDRGPFEGEGRVIDLSYAAAKALGMIRPGKALVRIEGLCSDGEGTAFQGEVKQVLAGDTLEVATRDRVVTVRLRAADSPEIGQPWGGRARDFTSDLLLGKVVVVRVSGAAAEGQVEAVVQLPDGRSLSAELVKAGLAWWRQDYQGQGRMLAALHLEAQYAGRGLWSDPAPVPPWEWRRLNGETR
ncbi:MAG: septal ring lytic transglycosylase RlpA family protein [Thermodesulfobacteriota bacterium]